MLRGRRILLAVTGGVAAYKSAYLARRLVENEAELKVIMSRSASEFIGAQTFAAITGEQPQTELFGQSDVSPHTNLARWAELVVVAPATASTIGKVVSGISNDLISAALLATTAPVVIAPAMHTEMWEHPATQRNVATLKEWGYHLVGPESGALAGGDVGLGRVAEPDTVLAAIIAVLNPSGAAVKVLVTAGGTREAIDPVRYLGNRSSGKMGHAIADAAARQGHRVTLVTTSSLPVVGGVEVVHVETAEEMLNAVQAVETDLAIMAAAVADFRPAEVGSSKIERSGGLDNIALQPTPDILASVVARAPRPYVVGFAAETGGVERAVVKASRKDVDLMVYNNVVTEGSGFGTDTNQVTIIARGGELDPWPQLPKDQVASRLVERAVSELLSRR